MPRVAFRDYSPGHFFVFICSDGKRSGYRFLCQILGSIDC